MNSFFTPIQPIKPIAFLEERIAKAENAGDAVPFASMLKEAVNEYETLQQTAEQDAAALTMGDADNLAQIQISSMKEQAALQTVVQLTSRAVNAYKEIMQMQI